MAVEVEREMDALWGAVGMAAAATAGEKVFEACFELNELENYLLASEPGSIDIEQGSADPLYSYLVKIVGSVCTRNVANAAAALDTKVRSEVLKFHSLSKHRKT